MTAALSAELRSVLEKIVQTARSTFEDDLAAKLEGRYGIHVSDGRVEPAEAVTLSASELAVRADLIEILDYLRGEGAGPSDAAQRLVREAAFTHLNRLIAVRVAEAIGIIPETLGNATDSSGFRDFAEIAPAVASTDWDRYALFIRICADELAADAPSLFDPRNPLIELQPSQTALSDAVTALAETGDDIWAAPDALGWTYQFFNTAAERREMRERSAPSNSRELAVRNQFFTPSYVVEFLVHNGLGAYLAAGIPGLVDHLPLLVEVPDEQRDIDLDNVSVLDPACGSGHFLLGAYDVLEHAWSLSGTPPEDAAPRIVRSLWGIEIDPRAAQIAQAAVIFRARRHCRSAPLPVPNVITARSLPTGPAIDELIAELPDHVARAVQAVADELVDAPLLGPLLKIEERLDTEVRDIFGTGVIEGTLAENADGVTDNVEAAVLDALSRIADAATSTAGQRLFAAEAHDAVRFVEAMNRRYTAVLMNPPFGEPVPETKTYLKAAYPWIPTKDYNLLAAFVGRGLELCEPEVGSCGAITSRAGLFASTFENWRKDILLAHSLNAAVDLGHGVMQQAQVEASAYVLDHTTATGTGTFVRLLKETDRPTALADAVIKHREGEPDPRVFEIDLSDLHAIPGSPVAYWMSDSIRRLFRDCPRLEGNGASVRQGLATGDDFQFVRAFWEVDPERIGYSKEDTRDQKRWVPFAKGGEYSPYWADIHLLVDWEDGGEHLRSFAGSVIRNQQYYSQPGFTWIPYTNSAFCPRVLPEGCVFSNGGPAAIVPGAAVSATAVYSSRLIEAILSSLVTASDETSSGGTKRRYEVGLVQKLPLLLECGERTIAQRIVERERESDMALETTRLFVGPLSLHASPDTQAVLDQLEDAMHLDTLVNNAASLGQQSLEYLDTEVWPNPVHYPETRSEDDQIADLYTRPMGQVIDELIAARGGSRAIANLTYVADRRIEVIAHGLRVNPRSIVRVVEERELSAPGELEDRSFRVLSYLVGLAFGRWDVRVGKDPSRADVPEDLLSPPARYSPGMLLDPNGQPPRKAPSDYPIDFPEDGILVDQAGHSRDIAERVRTAAVALWGSADRLDECLAVLMKRPSLVKLLRGEFFKSHLAMYSMSRRKAPIYWQLQVPSKAWGVWLYAPKLSREMLFGVVQVADQRLRLAEQQVARLQRELDDGSSGRKASAAAKELDAEQKLAVELAGFKAEAERIANLGWEPDLDDGMVLNAAPLAELFPAWKDAAKYRDELREGKYEWSTVARYAEEL